MRQDAFKINDHRAVFEPRVFTSLELFRKIFGRSYYIRIPVLERRYFLPYVPLSIIGD